MLQSTLSMNTYDHYDNDVVESAANSSTVNLGGNATFTGASEIVDGYTSLLLNIDSNVSSAADSVLVEFSPDATTQGARRRPPNWRIME